MARMREGAAVGALAVIIAITAGWWALALWPTGDVAPEWLIRTRDTCFGTAETGLPDAGGWLVMTGPPLSMLMVLLAGWGRDVKAGLRRVAERVPGQLVLGSTAALLVVGLLGVGVRVRVADAQPFATSQTEEVAGQLTRINDKPKALTLVNQHGDTVSLAQFAGRPVIVTFAYASRLPSIATRWGLSGDAHVLSGTPEAVERVLSAWRIPRARNERTGDLTHPSLVYVVGQDGKIAYAISGSEPVIRAAVEAL